jgi:hypothetical protein
MKSFCFIILFYLTFESVFSQSIYFNKRIDITGYAEVCRGIIPFNNGYLVAGGHGPGNKVYMSYLDSVGNLKWTQHYTETNYNYFFGLSGSLFQTKDNYVAICGSRVPAGPRGYSLLIKVDSLGNIKWEKEYQLSDHSNSLSSGNITNDSGYILTGRIIDPGPRNKYLLIKTDSLGSLQWYKMYTDSDPNRNYEGKSVIQTPDSGYCIGGGGGYWNPPAYKYHSIVEIIKTDTLGNEIWKKTYGNPNNCNWGTMLCLSLDSFIIASYSLAYSGDLYSDRQLYITKIGLDGIEKWNKKIGNIAPNKWSSWIVTLENNDIILCGNNAVKDTTSKVIGWIFKLNNNGDSLWYREYAKIQGSNEGNELWQVTSTPDGGFAGAGSLFPEVGNGTQDIWVFKTDSMGCLVPNCNVGITEFNPNSGAQMLVYPNPFKEAFAINYFIPAGNKEAVFQLYDICGKLVYQIGLTTSVNQLQVVASSLKAGIYVASLVVDGVLVKTEKIIKE